MEVQQEVVLQEELEVEMKLLSLSTVSLFLRPKTPPQYQLRIGRVTLPTCR